MAPGLEGLVGSVRRISSHTFSKHSQRRLRLLESLVAERDERMGVTVKHHSRVAQDPSEPNLRQIHLGSRRVTRVAQLQRVSREGRRYGREDHHPRPKSTPSLSPRVDRKGYSPVGGFIKPGQGFAYFGNRKTSGQGSPPASGFGSGTRDRTLPHEGLG